MQIEKDMAGNNKKPPSVSSGIENLIQFDETTEVRTPIPNISALRSLEAIVCNPEYEEAEVKKYHILIQKRGITHIRFGKDNGNSFYRAFMFSFLEYVLVKDFAGLNALLELIQSQEDSIFKLDSKLSEAFQILLSYFLQMKNKYGGNPNNKGLALRLFYKMVLYDDRFDDALIYFLKNAVSNYILLHQEDKLSEGDTLKKIIFNTSSKNVKRFIEENVMKDDIDAPDLIFPLVSTAMGVQIEIIEYLAISAKEKNIYFPSGNIKDSLVGKLGFPYIPMALLRTNGAVFDIVYPREFLSQPKMGILVQYDAKIDAGPIDHTKEILKPLCCAKGYYMKGYYRTMMKKHSKVVKKCLACGGTMDEQSYQQLLNLVPKWKWTHFLICILTMISFAVSVLFLCNHIFFN